MADAHVHAVTINSNTRSYTLRSVPSSPGRSFLTSPTTGIQLVMLELKLLHGKPCSAAEEVSPGQNCYNWPDLGFKTSNLGEWLDFDERNIFPKNCKPKNPYIYIYPQAPRATYHPSLSFRIKDVDICHCCGVPEKKYILSITRCSRNNVPF